MVRWCYGSDGGDWLLVGGGLLLFLLFLLLLVLLLPLLVMVWCFSGSGKLARDVDGEIKSKNLNQSRAALLSVRFGKDQNGTVSDVLISLRALRSYLGTEIPQSLNCRFLT